MSEMGKNSVMAEFRVVCFSDRLELIIGKNEVVARDTDRGGKDSMYKMLFDDVLKALGGRLRRTKCSA